jgi:hypothetical protein
LRRRLLPGSRQLFDKNVLTVSVRIDNYYVSRIAGARSFDRG